MITWIDHMLVLGFAVLWPLWNYLGFAEFRERVRRGVPGARLAGYAEGMITQWLFSAAAVVLWIHLSRDWGGLGLRGIGTGQAWMGLLVAIVLSGLMLAQSAVVASRPESHAEVRAVLLPYRELLPEQRSDLTGFIALSITAGVCEELLFRGVLPWYLHHWLGPWGAQGLALLVFALAHVYLDGRAVVRALLAGGVAAGLYLWTGSLLPGVVLHASVDVASGWMAYEVLKERAPAATSATAV